MRVNYLRSRVSRAQALQSGSGNARREASIATKTVVMSFHRKASEQDIELAERIDEFDLGG